MGKYEIYKSKDGLWRFRLKASNGRIVAIGEGYASPSNVRRGIRALKKLADSPEER